MGGCRNCGPSGLGQEFQDFNDGTLIRDLSPLPGPIHHDLTSARLGKEALQKQAGFFEPLLRRLRQARDSVDLQNIVVALLGPSSFSLGVIVGIGSDILDTVVELLNLVRIFVLADLHDARTEELEWWENFDPRMVSRSLLASLAATIFGEELRKAAEDRDALIKEISEVLKDPAAFFEGLADTVVKGYKKDWQDFTRHMDAGTLEGRYHAGEIFGRVLVDVLALITGLGGVGKTAAKVAMKLPRLSKYARVARLKPRPPGKARAGSGGVRSKENSLPEVSPRSAPPNPSRTTSKSELPKESPPQKLLPPPPPVTPGTPISSKILYGEPKPSKLREIRGGHSRHVLGNDDYRFFDVVINPDGTKTGTLIKRMPNGKWSKMKKNHTLFPIKWSDQKVIDAINEVAATKPIMRRADGSTLHRKKVDGVEIEVIKSSDDAVSAGYPNGGKPSSTF